jgi:hypothetical protein
MSKEYKNFEEFLKEYDEVTEGGLKYVTVDKERESITCTTNKLAYRSVHAPTYDIEMTFYFSGMIVYAVAEMDDEGDQWSEDYDERPFYGGDCGECEVEDAEHLAGLFDDTDWIEL